jgi:hypothetical protein
LDWFAERGWPVRGFVPPAWLLGEEAWQALRAFNFDYTTTFRRFHLLRGAAGELAGKNVQASVGPHAGTGAREAASILSPSLVYAARNRSGRLLSPVLADVLALALARRPLIRLGLHPPDVRYPRLLGHAQATVGRLLATHAALTKAAFAQRRLAITSTAPNSLRLPSGGVQSGHSSPDRCQSGAVPRGC